jgi:hypothetical protein
MVFELHLTIRLLKLISSSYPWPSEVSTSFDLIFTEYYRKKGNLMSFPTVLNILFNIFYFYTDNDFWISTDKM